MQLVTIQQLPGQARHSAFTDLCLWRGALYCAWREGEAHLSNDGLIRIACSKDGEHWHSLASLSMPGKDLRDARLRVISDQSLWLTATAAEERSQERFHQSHLWQSDNGRDWHRLGAIGKPQHWLWGWTAPPSPVMTLAYSCQRQRRLHLYRHQKGALTPVSVLPEAIGQASESCLHLDAKQQLHALVRRDPEPGLIAWANPPYEDWQWEQLPGRIAAPQWLVDSSGSYVSCLRVYQPEQRVAMFRGALGSGAMEETLALPGSGDCGYAGMTRWRGALWLSYYHSATGASRVYLAQIDESAGR